MEGVGREGNIKGQGGEQYAGWSERGQRGKRQTAELDEHHLSWKTRVS